jgi:hypothetical protein
MKTRLISAFLTLMTFLLPLVAEAQCAMCKGSAQATDESGQIVQQGINNGILYLLSLPFLLVGVVAALYIYYLRKSRTTAQQG